MSSVFRELLHVFHRTALFAVLAIPAVPVEKNEVMDSGAIERLFNPVQLRHRGAFTAQLYGVHLSHFHLSLTLRFFLPPTVEVPPY